MPAPRGAQQRLDGADTPARCPRCGRLFSAGAGCPDHGVPSARTGDGSPARESTTELPAIPGFRTMCALAWGGFGVVFVVAGERDGKLMAAKVARSDAPGAARRLEREVEALRAVGPPHVPAVHATGSLPDGLPYAVMDLIEVPTLAARLASTGPLPAGAFGTLALAVLDALSAVHARGQLHGDLKPENIFIDDRPHATLIDLGAAALDQAELGESGVIAVGTTAYMAPEQCDGRPDLDARTDVYAAGVVLYEMLTGRPPFWGAAAVVRDAHRTRRPKRPSALVPAPPAVEEVVMRCLEKRPQDRFADAAALRDALAAALADRARDTDDTPLAVALRNAAPASISGLTPSVQSRRRVGLIFLETDMGAVALHRRLLLLGGELAFAEGRRAVALFSHDVGDNPARRALRAAHALVQEGICAGALVDLATLTSQIRPCGARRYLGPGFLRGEGGLPFLGERTGVFLTQAASSAAGPDPAGAPPSRRWITSEPPPPADTTPTLVQAADMALTIPPLVGRDELIASLTGAACDVASGGPASVSVVIGGGGSGKSRVFRALASALAERCPDASLILVQAHEPGLGGAAGAIGDLLRQALNLPERPPDGGRSVLTERLPGTTAALWPAVALALRWLRPDSPAVVALGAAPGALRSALIVAAGEALRARAAASGACLLLLDDAHLADEATLAALEYASLAEAGAPLWICAFARSTFEEARPEWGARAGRKDLHRIGPLDAASAATLCRRLLLPAVDVPESVIQRLVARAQGLPLLLIELVRGLKREGAVRRDPRDGSVHLATERIDRLPDLPALEWLAGQELEALPVALQAHARLLALLGEEVTTDEVRGTLRFIERQGGAADFPLDASAGTQRLLGAGLLVSRGAERVAFRYPLLREEIERTTPEPLRAQVHRAAVEHYRGTPGDAWLDRLAVHAAAAGLVEEGAAAYLRLAEAASARHAYLDAEICATRALELTGALPLAARRGRGLARFRLGRLAEALEDLDAARALASSAGDAGAEIEILLEEAEVLDWMGDYRGAEERALAAQARAGDAVLSTPPNLFTLGGSAGTSPAAPPNPLRHLEARLLLAVGRSLHRADREAEAAETLLRAAELAARLDDEGYEPRVISLLLLGFILPGLGRPDEAVVALDEVIQRCEEHGDWMHLGAALNNRALLRAKQGDLDGMLADFTRTLQLGRELGHAALELGGEFNLAEHLYWMDDPDAAEPHAKAAAAVAMRMTGGWRPAVVALLEGRLRLYRGDDAGALSVAGEIRAQQEAARARGEGDGALSPSEDVLCAMIELAARDAGDEAWDALEERSARSSVGQEQIEVLEARALAALRRGRRAEAAAQLARARAAAERIPNVMAARLRRWCAEAGCASD